jgi:hypothetical protein
MLDLNTLLLPTDPLYGQSILSEASAINDAGQIVAYGCVSGRCDAYVLTPVTASVDTPEPATLSVLATVFTHFT